MSSELRTCEFCNHPFPISRTNCPHCARPQLFPNVSLAKSELETEKLEAKFHKNKQLCDADGRSTEFQLFYNATSKAHALFACDLLKLHREIASGTEIIETYYQLEELRLRATLPKNYDWDKLRPQAEIELLGSHHNIENLHYACLSLDWNSLTSYGNCIIKLDESMIAHRASCFEGNTAVIFATLKNFDNCLRSCWEERGKIAVTAFARYLTRGIDEDGFSKILVATGTSSADDKFIEVHIFGTMTARTFAEVTLPAKVNNRDSIYRAAIIEKLNKVNVKHIC